MGANDASNAFGTAVATRMIRFSTAAFLCSVFVIIGAITSGTGAAEGLGQLGAINALPAAFTAALAAAVTVAWMSKVGLPASTSQAVVGSIIGWNLFSGSPTDLGTLRPIVATWAIGAGLGWGLPTIPLLPVSGSQAVIGFVLLFVVPNVFGREVFLPHDL